MKSEASSIALSIGACGLLLCIAGLPVARASDDRITGSGTYQTSFEIPVPPSPAAPKVLLTYDSGTNGSLAGIGWDLSVGWPVSIARDIRLGTLEWKGDTPWLWGSTPLVPKAPTTPPGTDPFDCATGTEKQFRTAPDNLACVALDLTPRRESARVRLATGATLLYQPILYDGVQNPAAPAGNDTQVMSFRLASVTDRNGYRSCYAYKDFNDTQFGKLGVLEEISYGPGPQAGDCSNAAFRLLHRVVFDYADMTQAGYFASWTLRYGAPIKFGSLLQKITIYAAGRNQDEYGLVHEGTASETRQPRLVRIEHTVRDATGQPKTRVERSFQYGERRARFDGGQFLALAPNLLDLRTFPDSIAGSVTRPMMRPQLLDNPLGAGQIGQDVQTDVAPVTYATTEQWSMMDINGDGLPDFQWSKEKGTDPSVPDWTTYGVGIDRGVLFSDRPAQQAVILNEGIAAGSLATSTQFLNSHAPSLESQYPSPANENDNGPGAWFWGEGKGRTRTGMPMSVSAGEIGNPAATCPFSQVEDSRLWPRYPDGTDHRPSSSINALLSQPDLLPNNINPYLGNPVLEIIQGINHGYHPNYGVSSVLSGWVDLDGDGVKEFVSTPSWIERFTINPSCHPSFLPANIVPGPGQKNARDVIPAVTGGGTQPLMSDTAWYQASFGSTPGASCTLCLNQVPGPPGLIGLPLSYETSTVAPTSIGLTIPVSGVLKAVASAIASWSWMPLASAGPGHTVDAFTPRSAPGYSLSVSTPSATGLMQGIGSAVKTAVTSQTKGDASTNSSAGDIASLIISMIPVNYDLTLFSTSTTSRSQAKAHLMDINGDGLPDYVLYNTGSPADRNAFLNLLGAANTTDPLLGLMTGDLVAFMNSADGTFSPPKVINSGMNYASVPDFAAIDNLVSNARDTISSFGTVTDRLCYLTPVVGCAEFKLSIAQLAQQSTSFLNTVKPLMASMADTTPRERSMMTELEALDATLISLIAQLAILQDIPLLIDSAAATARALVEDMGYLARTVREIGHPSRINLLSNSFSQLSGSRIDQSADGTSAQTRGFIDLNGDGLPDYVNTNSGREPICAPGQWEVFWGTGTSSISAQRAFLSTPSCISVPAAPIDVIAAGYATLPLSVDRVLRAPTIDANAGYVDTVVHSYVSLVDLNHDGRPDILIAGNDPWDAAAVSRTWRVYLNNGAGFDLTQPLSVPSPATAITGTTPASPEVSSLAVPYPVMGTTRARSNVQASRNTSSTHAAFVDLDGDGVDEVVRRVRRSLPDGSSIEGLLVWRRQETGPQDLMIEERSPLEGHREQVEYRPFPSFQWDDGQPDGKAPRLGHQPTSGVRGRLVRWVTSEPLLARPERRTRRGYDYKLPFFDKKTRTPAGFAVRSSVLLDPQSGTPIAESLEETLRAAQRPDMVAGVTTTRLTHRGSRAPVHESLVSYAEVTTTSGGIGGLNSIFAAPTRRFEVEYPSGLNRGALFDVGFDGRQPFRERVSGSFPLSSTLPSLDPFAATGGAARWNVMTTGIVYRSPHPPATGTATPLSEATVEAWVKPGTLTSEHTIIDAGAYRLFIARSANEFRFQFSVTGGPTAIASTPVTAERWHHVAASFGQGQARLFVDGHTEASVANATAPIPNSNLVVGCASLAAGGQDRCFMRDIGELQLYPEA